MSFSFRNCMADVCSCSKSDCHCKSIVSYINQCQGVGLSMSDALANWKTLTSCDAPINTTANASLSVAKAGASGPVQPLKLTSISNNDSITRTGLSCPAGSIFRPCASACKRSCKRRATVTSCRKGCRPGCECPPHLVWHESRCIKASLCPTPAPVSLKRMLH